MKLHWGHYCIFIGAIILLVVEIFIAFNPSLDTSFMPIWIGNQPLYRTHNYFEMAGFFMIGLGIAKTLQTKTTPKKTKFLQIFGKLFAWFIFLGFVIYSLAKAIEMSTSIIFTSFGVILLVIPLPLGYYMYKFYHCVIRKKTVLTGLTIKKADLEDVRTLIVRVSPKNLKEFYGDDCEYCDGKPISLGKNGKKAYAILQISTDRDIGNNIKADYWVRQKLNVKEGDIIEIRNSIWARYGLFWRTMIFNHPDLNQRWENFGIFLAVLALIFDIFLRLIDLQLQLEFLIAYWILVLLISGLGLPHLLLPHK